MDYPWHRISHGVSLVPHLDSSLMPARMDGPLLELAVAARWHKMQSVPFVQSRQRKPRQVWRFVAGLLAVGVLAFGIFIAASDTCEAAEIDAAGNYSQSTLAPITTSGADAASAGGNCKPKRSTSRIGYPKTRP